MSLSNPKNWLHVPGGLYEIGCSKEEAEVWAADLPLVMRHRRFLGDAGIPLPLADALPRRRVWVSGFYVGPLNSGPMVFDEALRLAGAEGGRLPTDCEWEIAERYFPGGISQPGQDEWCMDFFDASWKIENGAKNPLNLSADGDRSGTPAGRRVIRGRNFPLYHPAMRFHGAADNEPIGNTGYRIVFPDP